MKKSEEGATGAVHATLPLDDGDENDELLFTLLFFGLIAMLITSFAYCVYKSTVNPCVKKPKAL